MTAFDANRSAFAVSVTAGRISYMLVSALGAISAWNDTRVTRKSLSKLSNRELDDIGLTRSDIDRVAIMR